MRGKPGSEDVSTTGKHIAALDGLRGLALLMVLMDHLLWSNTEGVNRWQTLLLSLHVAGWIGVDLFFVLSGFLITGILYDSLPSRHFFRNFYARRALRIFPLYYATLLVLIGVCWLTGAPWNLSALRLLTYTQNLSWRGMRLPTAAPWVNINHFWSLAIEEQFYLLWPPLVFRLRTLQRITIAATAGIAFSLAVRLFLWHSAAERINPYLLYVWTPARFDGLLMGALLAMGLRMQWFPWMFRWCRPVLWGCCCLLGAIYVCYPGLPVPLVPGLLVWSPILLAVLFAALLVDTLRPGSASGRLCATPPLRFFGRYSYGLYVFHPMVGAFTLTPLRWWLRAHGMSRGTSVLGSASVTLLLTVLLAWCSFRFFEQPLLRLKRYFHHDSSRPNLSKLAEQDTQTAKPACDLRV